MAKKIKPDIVAGGSAIDLGNGLFYMRGRTHKQGGIDIGKNPETGIEVENGEIYDVYKGRVFSAQPIFNGISPANALLMGGNPNSIFNAQELWKQEHRVNDDGTKFKTGGYTPSKEIIDYIKKTEGFRDKWYKDGNGIDTIGYGFTGSRIKKLYPNGITREQADKEFADSIAKRALILAKDTPNWDKLSQNQRDALLSYHYNVGEGSYRNKHPKLQQALTNLDWDNVALNMDAGYNDKKNPGLRTRRDYERQLFRSGINASSTGDEEKNFRDWYNTYARAHNLDLNPDAKEHYYDYRAYYKNRTKEQANEEWKLDNHLPDTYKLPGHPTFSVESIYSTRKTPGGTWKKVGLGPVYDEQFVDSKYTKGLKTYKNVSFKYGGKMTKQYFITPNNIYKLGGDIRRKAVLGTEDVIPIRKIKVNNRDAWDVDGKIVYSEAEAYRLAGRFADAQGTLDMSETLEPSIVTAERNTSSINDAIPISKIKVNGKDAWDVDGRIIFNEQEAYRYRSRLADIQGSLDMSEELNPSVVTAERTYRPARPGVRQNTIGFIDSLAGTSYYGPQRTNEVPAPQTPTQPTQATQPATPQRSQYSTIRIDTSGRPTRGLGVTPLRPYDGRPIETQGQTPASGSQSSSTGGQRRTTRSSVPTTPIIPIDYNSIDSQINESNQRILRESLYPTLEPLATITSPGAVTPQTIVDNNRRNPVRLRGNGINIKNGADWLGLGINLAGNLASSLINRSAIKRLNYGDAPIPLSAQKLKTEINVNPQVDQIRENVAGQERLIADNTADSRVALARRQRLRNLGTEQFQSLMGQKENMETQLINRDRLNRQGVNAQNITQYNQWRRGAYDFENRRREMLAENAVAGINNAAEAIAGERGILARREGRNRDILNAALIAATSPNAQNVIGSKEFAKFLEQLGYTGDFSLLRKRLNIG